MLFKYLHTQKLFNTHKFNFESRFSFPHKIEHFWQHLKI